MVILGTNVLLLAFAFQRDSRQPVNTTFLEQIQAENPAITIYSLMEILGQLSFILSAERLSAWQSWLVEAYGLTIIWLVDPQDAAAAFSFRAEICIWVSMESPRPIPWTPLAKQFFDSASVATPRNWWVNIEFQSG